jgi:hypothetical protein
VSVAHNLKDSEVRITLRWGKSSEICHPTDPNATVGTLVRMRLSGASESQSRSRASLAAFGRGIAGTCIRGSNAAAVQQRHTHDSESTEWQGTIGGFVVLCSPRFIIGFAGLILARERMCIQDDPGPRSWPISDRVLHYPPDNGEHAER